MVSAHDSMGGRDGREVEVVEEIWRGGKTFELAVSLVTTMKQHFEHQRRYVSTIKEPLTKHTRWRLRGSGTALVLLHPRTLTQSQVEKNRRSKYWPRRVRYPSLLTPIWTFKASFRSDCAPPLAGYHNYIIYADKHYVSNAS